MSTTSHPAPASAAAVASCLLSLVDDEALLVALLRFPLQLRVHLPRQRVLNQMCEERTRRQETGARSISSGWAGGNAPCREGGGRGGCGVPAGGTRSAPTRGFAARRCPATPTPSTCGSSAGSSPSPSPGSRGGTRTCRPGTSRCNQSGGHKRGEATKQPSINVNRSSRHNTTWTSQRASHGGTVTYS